MKAMKYTFFFFAFLTTLILFSSHAYADNKTVSIPLGASNPHTETQAQYWYKPPIISVHVGDTVTWQNDDNEIHTVTSGKGSGRLGFTQNKFGTPDGYFSSGPFKPGKTWSFTFNKTGTYTYFCTIHPWMEGVVVVSNSIPDNPVDGNGVPITSWPVLSYTQDGQIETDLSWEPHVILTGQKETFVYQFYNKYNSQILSNTDYEFVIIQNGQELLHTSGTTSVGGDYRNFVFQNPGKVIFKFEKIGGKDLSAQYSTIVYDNPSNIKESAIVQPARNVLLGQLNVILLLFPMIITFTVIIVYYKGWFRRKPAKSESRSPV